MIRQAVGSRNGRPAWDARRRTALFPDLRRAWTQGNRRFLNRILIELRVGGLVLKRWITGRMLIEEPIAAAGAPFGIEHIDSLYRYAIVLTGSRVEAEDLVQETYVRAIEAFDRLRENSNLRGWLFTILRNLWFNELRKRRRGPQLVEADADNHIADGLAGSERNAQQIFESGEDVKRVRAAMQQLPSHFREILVLREFEELSYQEIAAVLDCPAGTVMSRLGRARAKLRELLTGEWERPLQSGRMRPA
jgi:RNA polymerase sigma-70 factor, ECF subfamily